MTNVRPLPAVLQRNAIEELHEEPTRLDADIAALKAWIEKEPHLNARADAQFLVAFLRGCKFSLEKAKSKIERYYTLKTKYPDFYTIENFDDPSVLERVRLGVGIPLPTPLNDHGPRLMFIRPGHYPVDKYNFQDIICLAHAMEEMTLFEDDYAIVNGYVDVLDFAEMSTAHFLQLTPTIIKKMSVYAEDALPLRQRATHIFNAPAGFEKFFNMFKPLMPQKQQERLFVHGSDLQSLFAHVPQKYLPKEYGGENGSIPEIMAEVEKSFLNHRDYFIEDKKYRNDESLRVGKQVDYDSVFGVEGSFRKLNVD